MVLHLSRLGIVVSLDEDFSCVSWGSQIGDSDAWQFVRELWGSWCGGEIDGSIDGVVWDAEGCGGV